MIICICKSVNDSAIRRAIAEGHESFEALQFELGVGTCCGKCVPMACALLDAAQVDDVAPPIRPSNLPPRKTLRMVQRVLLQDIVVA